MQQRNFSLCKKSIKISLATEKALTPFSLLLYNKINSYSNERCVIMRKTKIVCTVGPATDDEAVMRQLMLEGMRKDSNDKCQSQHGNHG